MKKPLVIYSPWHLQQSDTMPPLGQFGWRFLAEGDSWFSIGALNPAKNSNLLFEMEFEQSACAVNCASPGDTLRRMSQINTDRNYVALLAGRTARLWDGILLSCGGNDMIDALGVHGPGIAPDKRLLLESTEWGDVALGARRYLSDAGWQTFSAYLKANLDLVIALRERGPSQGAPIFLHGYAVPMPRPAGAGLGAGPWLLPAVQAYSIPEDDYAGVARELISRLATLLAECAADNARFPNLHFFDTTQIEIEPAQRGADAESGDWINEIHLTWRGCQKLAVPWGEAIEKVLMP